PRTAGVTGACPEAFRAPVARLVGVVATRTTFGARRRSVSRRGPLTSPSRHPTGCPSSPVAHRLSAKAAATATRRLAAPRVAVANAHPLAFRAKRVGAEGAASPAPQG